MVRFLVMSQFLAAWALLYPAGAQGQDAALAQIAVRVYNVYRVPARHVRSAGRTATSIFARAGLRVTRWRECPTSATPAAVAIDECSETLAPNEVVVRIVETPKAWAKRWARKPRRP